MKIYRIYFKDGNYVDFKATNLITNKISDELIFFNNDDIIATFYINSIAGYIIMREV